MKEKYFTVSKNISRWKLDNRFENLLAYLADKYELAKSLYVLYYRLFDSKYYWGGVKLAGKQIDRQFLVYDKIKDTYTKKYLIKDMIYSLHRFGSSFEEYFIFKFYEKNAVARAKYNTLKLQYGYSDLVNDSTIRDLFENKYSLYTVLGKYYKREMVYVRGQEDIEVLKTFIEKHRSFIYKPILGHSGQGIKIYTNFEDEVEALYVGLIKYGDFVLEELIEQAEEMSMLHRESINTVRMATFTINKQVHIIGTALRMGVGKSNVDNAGSGGIYANVDEQYGIVNSKAINNIGETYTMHPNTQTVIPGFKIPEWNEAIKVVKNVACEIPGATMIAWDLSYSKKGWVIVEGNDVGGPDVLQGPLQCGIKDKFVSLIDMYYKNKQK